MREGDIRALYAYLRSVPFSDQQNCAHDLPWYLSWRARRVSAKTGPAHIDTFFSIS